MEQTTASPQIQQTQEAPTGTLVSASQWPGALCPPVRRRSCKGGSPTSILLNSPRPAVSRLSGTTWAGLDISPGHPGATMH